MSKTRMLSRNGLMQLLGLRPKDAKMTIRTQLTEKQRLDALEAKRASDQAWMEMQIAQLRLSYRGEPMSQSSRQSAMTKPAGSSRPYSSSETSRSEDSSSSLATAMLYASAFSSQSTSMPDYSSSSSSDSSSSFSSGGGGDYSGGGSSGTWD